MEELACVGFDGETRNFSLERLEDDQANERLENDPTHLCFRVIYPGQDEFFYTELAPLGPDYRIHTITHNQSALYKGKRIADVLIPKLANDLEVRIFSSLELDDGSEQHNSNAERMWRRLASNGLASFDEGTGRYCHPPQ